MTERARYWSDQLAAWSQSGLSQAEFCRRHGISGGTFAWWKRQLQGPSADAAKRRGRPPKMSGRLDSRSVGPGLRNGSRGRLATERFVEVRLTSANSPRQARSLSLSKTVEPTGLSSHAGYEIVVAQGRSIRVPSQFDPQILSRLIAVVESC